jgi:hypothetical protein
MGGAKSGKKRGWGTINMLLLVTNLAVFRDKLMGALL